MQNINKDTITDAVIQRLADTPDPRLKEILTSLVHHLHDFAREVKLTEKEWSHGIQFLTATGQKCDDKRQEFILLSDTLGLSMLVVAMNNDKPEGCTEATVFGPFHVEGAPHYQLGDDLANGSKGDPCLVRGKITDLDGNPIANATIDVWHADSEGNYDVQYAGLEEPQGRGVLHSAADGSFYFKTVAVVAYPIPVDGTVGDMLRATNRHPWRPGHLHFMVKANGYETLITHVFRKGDQYLESDAVFGVRSSLIGEWVLQKDARESDGAKPGQPFYTLDFDLVLNKQGR